MNTEINRALLKTLGLSAETANIVVAEIEQLRAENANFESAYRESQRMLVSTIDERNEVK